MSISGIASGSSYLNDNLQSFLSTVSKGSSTARSSSTQDTFTSTLASLESAIQSGNLDSADAALAQMEQASPRAANGTDPVGTFLTSVQNALSSGNMSAAQSALTTFESAAAAGASGTSAGGGFGSELSQLASSIQSGDLTTAQSIVSKLEQHAPKRAEASTSASSAAQSSPTDPLGTFLHSVESSVTQGSLSAAQAALAAFQSQMSPIFSALSAGTGVNALA